MARTKRSASMDTRNSRLRKLKAGKMHQEPLAPGQYLAYRRPEKGGAGPWFARLSQDGKILQARLGTADDYADADGETVLNFVQAQTKAQAWFDGRKEDARSVSDGGSRIKVPLTVALALEAYLADMDRQGKKSAADARKRATLHILPGLGGIEVEKLTRLRIEKWRDALAASPKARKARKKAAPQNPRKPEKHIIPKPAPPSTPDEKRARKASTNRVLSTLKAALTYALDRDLVRCPDDAWTRTKPFRETDEPRQNYLTPEEQQRLLNAIKEPDFKRLVAGALATGCRYGELGRMTVGDFDPVGGTMLVREAKSGKPRRVPLTAQGQSFFEGISAGRERHETLFTREAFQDMRRVDPVTKEAIEKVQRAWKPSEQKRMMADACDAASLPRMGFHQLRHSYASALVAAGMPLAFVAQLTGHADTRMLEKNYAHLASSDVKKALETFAPSLDLGSTSIKTLKIAGRRA